MLRDVLSWRWKCSDNSSGVEPFRLIQMDGGDIPVSYIEQDSSLVVLPCPHNDGVYEVAANTFSSGFGGNPHGKEPRVLSVGGTHNQSDITSPSSIATTVNASGR